MKESELKEKIKSIQSNLKLFDGLVHSDMPLKDGKHYINERQRDAVDQLLEFLSSLNWQLNLNAYKTLHYTKDSTAIKPETTFIKAGTPVKISPCGKEYEGKTYFGILIGNVAMGISATIDKNEDLHVKYGYHNPGIFVPELNKMVYGYESWWGAIESEDELKEVITKETIDNVWYMKLLKNLTTSKKEENKNDV